MTTSKQRQSRTQGAVKGDDASGLRRRHHVGGGSSDPRCRQFAKERAVARGAWCRRFAKVRRSGSSSLLPAASSHLPSRSRRRRGGVRTMAVPQRTLHSGSTPMPRIGLGTASFPLSATESTQAAVLRAIYLGYCHLDTAAIYGSEEPVGQAVAEALSTGLITSRDELFITSKLWIRDAQAHLVLPALQRTLKNLQLEYLNLYLIHFPISAKPQGHPAIITEDELMPIDLASVWKAMEECQRMGLTKSIGVSNFSSKKIETLLATAEIPPAANQVEVNPLWQQKKLREFCLANGIQFCAFSPLGGKGTGWGKDWVMECDVLHEIAKAKGKSVAQICLRWVFEQGDVVIVKTFKENEMLENLDILNWELTDEERDKISRIPQRKSLQSLELVSEKGPYKSIEELWDDCI